MAHARHPGRSSAPSTPTAGSRAHELGTYAADALRVLHKVLKDDRRDDDGKPVVPASVRVDVGKYLVDQFMGKAKISVDVHEDNSLLDMMGLGSAGPSI